MIINIIYFVKVYSIRINLFEEDHQKRRSLSASDFDKNVPIESQWRVLGGATITIKAKNIIGMSMKIVTDAIVSIIAPKQPQSMLRPWARTTDLAMKKDRLINPMPKAASRVNTPKSKPSPHNNSMKGIASPKGRAKNMGRMPKLYTASTEYCSISKSLP